MASAFLNISTKKRTSQSPSVDLPTDLFFESTNRVIVLQQGNHLSCVGTPIKIPEVVDVRADDPRIAISPRTKSLVSLRSWQNNADHAVD